MKKHKKTKIKSLCKLSKKEVEANLDEVALLVTNPKHICVKCARVAKKGSNLCEPKGISN